MAFGAADFKAAFPFGNSTFANAGGAVSDLFAYKASGIKATGDLAEAGGYARAAALARENIPLEEAATKIQQTQVAREALKTIGGQEADISGAGFAASGTALDLLRSSASQGALASQLIGEQGAIQVNAYEQQAEAYDTMSEAATFAANAEKQAGKGDLIGGAIKGAGAIASVASIFL